MKNLKLMFLALGVITLSACGNGNNETPEEATTYTLDSEATTLAWTGSYVADGHTHSGTVKIESGEMTFKGESFESGSFSIDMLSIENNDLDGPKRDTLVSHLNGMYFFNTAQHGKVVVTVNEVSKTEIKANVNVMGKDVKAIIPIKIKKDDKILTAKGKFNLDFSSTGIIGFSPAPGDPENMHVDSNISFELNLKMKK